MKLCFIIWPKKVIIMRHQQKYLGHRPKAVTTLWPTSTDCRLFLNPTDIEGFVTPSVAQTSHRRPWPVFAKNVASGLSEFNFQYLQQLKISKTEHTNLKNASSARVLRNYIQRVAANRDLTDDWRRVAQLIEKADRVYFWREARGSSLAIWNRYALRVICEALTDADGFAWTTSILN